MSDGVTRAMIDAAVLADDAAALEAMIHEAGDLKALLAGYPSHHPLCHVKSPEVAALLVPFAGKEQLKEAIWVALRSNPTQPAVLRALVEQGRDKLGMAFHEGHVLVDERRDYRASALHVAARRDCLASIRCLLEFHPYLELENGSGRTALACAVDALQIEAADVLLAAGADPNAAVGELSADALYAPLARRLLEAGARTTRAVGVFFTLLPSSTWDRIIAQAAPAHGWRRDDVEAVFQRVDVRRARALLAAGADRDAAQAGAVRNPEPGVLALTMPAQSGFAPAALSALVTDPRRLATALNEGLNPNALDAGGCTLLTAAARELAFTYTEESRRRLRRSIRLLVRAGADRTGRQGRSSPIRVFLSVAGEPHVDSLRFLLRLELRDPLALHFVCREGALAATTFLAVLLEYGHNPNAVDRLGRTPLHLLAAREPTAEAAELAALLLQAGTDAALTDPAGLTALDLAIQGKRTRLVECLAADARRSRAAALTSPEATARSSLPRRGPSL